MHAAGGPNMLSAGVHGLAEGARKAGLEPPVALAVTILTSEGTASSTVLAGRVAAAVEAGCGGVVCAASDVAEVKGLAPQLLVVVPGIRPPGTPVNDQGRPATPAEALAAGADLLVVGRAVTAAPDPCRAAADLADSVA
jgi:orotidine-5'-phosphate decarboxylase